MKSLNSRRRFRRTLQFPGLLAVSALAMVACTSAAVETTSAPVPDSADDAAAEVTLVNSIRSLSNPYHANWVLGGEMYGEYVGQEVTALTDEADSQRQLSQIRNLGAAGEVFALNVDPNSSSDAEAIVRAVTEAGGYVVTQWNKPDDLNPWDVSDNWVAHIGFNGADSGVVVSQALFDAMGGEGGIIAIQGILDNVPAKQRFAGLETALESNPGITLLDNQTANWSRTEAFEVTQSLLSLHGDDVKGVWAANDNMALGALEALDAAGLLGQIPVIGFDAVPEALEDIDAGVNGFVATVSTDPFWQGGAGLALAHKAATGEIDVSKLTNDQRAFYADQVIITADNVKDFIDPPVASSLFPDFDDPFARLTGPIN